LLLKCGVLCLRKTVNFFRIKFLSQKSTFLFGGKMKRKWGLAACSILRSAASGACEILPHPAQEFCKLMTFLLPDVVSKPKGREIFRLEKTETDFGPGYRALLRLGSSERRECFFVQDKNTGEWKTFGDPRTCQIARRTLRRLNHFPV